MHRSTIPAALLAATILAGAMAGCASEGGDTADTATAAAPAQAPAAGAASGAFLNPDSATREQLVVVAGMTPAAADSLIAHRPYRDMTAVDRVLAAQIGEPQRDSIYMRVWKPIDLNTASDEEILLIPTVGDRMLGEFKEYRPYTSIEQFRREIGKYVDDSVVTRFERYVTIR